MTEPLKAEDLARLQPIECVKVQLFTIAKVRRTNPPPRRCSRRGLYHVWIWKSHEIDPDISKPPKGAKCQCGLLTEWP